MDVWVWAMRAAEDEALVDQQTSEDAAGQMGAHCDVLSKQMCALFELYNSGRRYNTKAQTGMVKQRLMLSRYDD